MLTFVEETAQENEALIRETIELKRALEASSSMTNSDNGHIKAEMRAQAAERNLWEARQATVKILPPCSIYE